MTSWAGKRAVGSQREDGVWCRTRSVHACACTGRHLLSSVNQVHFLFVCFRGSSYSSFKVKPREISFLVLFEELSQVLLPSHGTGLDLEPQMSEIHI